MSEIDKALLNFNLRLSQKYPFDTKIYLYADYFELVSLFSHDKVGIGEMLDRLKDEGVLGSETEKESDTAPIKDKDEAFVRSVFEIIQQRQFEYNDFYPFKYQDSFIEVKDNITEQQKLYVFLLIASNLNLFDKFKSDLTTEFEKLSKLALINYLPEFAKVKGFGKNSDYSGTAVEKIKKLAADMNVGVNEHYLVTVSQKGTQDLGLDIVAWLPFKDKLGNFISVFAQCACGKDWNKKLSETRRYNKFLDMYLSQINHAIFIPYSLINYNNNTFYEHHEFGDPILVFERNRILSLIKDYSVFSQLKSKKVVEKCIEYTEDIV